MPTFKFFNNPDKDDENMDLLDSMNGLHLRSRNKEKRNLFKNEKIGSNSTITTKSTFNSHSTTNSSSINLNIKFSYTDLNTELRSNFKKSFADVIVNKNENENKSNLFKKNTSRNSSNNLNLDEKSSTTGNSQLNYKNNLNSHSSTNFHKNKINSTATSQKNITLKKSLIKNNTTDNFQLGNLGGNIVTNNNKDKLFQSPNFNIQTENKFHTPKFNDIAAIEKNNLTITTNNNPLQLQNAFIPLNMNVKINKTAIRYSNI
jgi:hypothetical protein